MEDSKPDRPTAGARARAFFDDLWKQGDYWELEGDGPWDLVVMSETIYYLGWLYPFFDIAWLAGRLFASAREGGRLLMANSFSDSMGRLLHPALIRTYRDLFVNVGFRVERE